MAGERPGEGEVARPLAVAAAAEVVDARGSSSASSPMPALKVKRRPLTRPSEIRRSRREPASSPRARDRVAREPERAREHARPAARDEADGDVGLERRSRPR